MNRRSLASALGVALLMSAVAAAAAPTGSRYSLRHRVAAGDRHIWDSTNEVSMTLTARSGDQEAPSIQSTTRHREKIEEEVLAAGSDTVTRLRQRFLAARDFSTDPMGHQAMETSSLQ